MSDITPRTWTEVEEYYKKEGRCSYIILGNFIKLRHLDYGHNGGEILSGLIDIYLDRFGRLPDKPIAEMLCDKAYELNITRGKRRL